MPRTSSILVFALLTGACAGTPKSSPVNEAPPSAKTSGEFASGYTRLQLQDEARQRPVWVDLWYPGAAESVPQEIRYDLSRGTVARNARAAKGQYPLILLSHGTGGSATNYAWLGEKLASAGFIVAGVNHYRDSRSYGDGSVDVLAALQPWLRVDDMIFAHQALTTTPPWSASIKLDRLYLAGHSAGAFTVMAAAGVDYDLEKMAEYCANESANEDRGCLYVRDLTPEQLAKVPPRPAPDNSHKLKGVRGVLLMDAALGPAYTSESLSHFSVPVIVAAADPGDFLPFRYHSGRLLEFLPQATPLKLEHAGHFSFLPECDLEIDIKGISLCKDDPRAPRRDVQRKVIETTLRSFGGN
jgi:predicted dienelactone hydrolase